LSNEAKATCNNLVLRNMSGADDRPGYMEFKALC
jgi:hypothetical protein